MAKSKEVLHKEIRQRYMADFLARYADEEVKQTKSNEFTIPITDSEGNEGRVLITFKVSTESKDIEAYDKKADLQAKAEMRRFLREALKNGDWPNVRMTNDGFPWGKAGEM